MTTRAAGAESTRARIVQAAVELYRRQGVAATTVGQVAARADVARATVVNHFGGGDGLTAAALESIQASLEVPTQAIFKGARSQAERLRRLTTALFSLYERSTPWFLALQTEMRTVPALRRHERRYWTEMQKLYGEAMGPLARNRVSAAAVVGLTSPATFGALRQSGLSASEAADVVGDLLALAVKGRRFGT